MMLNISIIIPCYNHGKYLLDAINSIKQFETKYSYEIIVVNDGSTDPFTLQVLERLEYKEIIIVNQKNQGLAAARNNAISKAKGEYILPLDSDNKIHRNYLTRAVDILEKDPSIDVVYGNPVYFGDSEGCKKVGNFRFSKMIQENYIDACAIFRKSIWETVQGYDGRMPAMGNEDWEFWIHVYLSGGKFYYLDSICFYYRVLSDSMSVTTTRPGFKLNKEYIYQKHLFKIIECLSSDLSKNEEIVNYINKEKFKSIAKIFLGYKF